MEFTLIWVCGQKESNEITRASIENLKQKENIVLAADEGCLEDMDFASGFKKTVGLPLSDKSESEQLNCAREHSCGDYVTVIEPGDVVSENFFEMADEAAGLWSDKPVLFICERFDQGNERDVFCRKLKNETPFTTVDFTSHFSCVPYSFGGTFIRTDYFKTHSVDERLKYDYAKAYILPATLGIENLMVVTGVPYKTCAVPEWDPVFYPGVYDEEWYRSSVDMFWTPFLKETKDKMGYIPEHIQYFAICCLGARFRANLNNTNKHIIPEDEAYDYMAGFGKPFSYLEDSVLLNSRRLMALPESLMLRQLYLRIKHKNSNLQFEHYIFKSRAYLGYGNVLLGAVSDQNVNIKFVEYKDGILEIDASVSGLLDFDDGELFIRKNEDEYIEPQWDEIYSLEKCFGVSYTKRHAFHVSVPVGDKERETIAFFYQKGRRKWKLTITYASHFSKLSKRFKNSYWNINGKLMARHTDGCIVIYQIRKRSVLKREVKLLAEMILTHRKEAVKYAFYRLMYFVYAFFYRKKRIWLYIDKIYKAGDSSEYIYKYACAQHAPDIVHYYLTDKNSADFLRLKREGYKPLARASFKHRMVFLLADTVVISNSTVFAYNDYTLSTSEYVRDLIHFRVACVQHGMSVQNIAVAQNRLRDNISLYFCASPYEIENLSRPVYGYAGRNILKLTGVPRYDGLVNRDKKQILITPTWRMQAAVPVTKNEGVARDYNPLFKETSYYQVYNSLINNPVLIESARKYGYRIVYVLHPIVSPQADDFDKNPYVDVVPAIGDMSYEKVFCESSLMVTDFSGVQFDFAYMRKPVVYYHTPLLPPHYDEGGFVYETMGFGEICGSEDELIRLLCEYMEKGCVMDAKYRKRADDFFAFNDHKNCERIYGELIKR